MIVGAEEPERKVGLGGQDEDEEGGGQAQMAAQQPEPDGHRHQGHRDGGQQLEDERGQERHFQRGHGRLPVLVGDVTDGRGLGLGPTEDLEGGQAGDHVEEMAGQALEEPGLARHPGPGGGAHQAHEHGIRGTVTAMITADIQSAPSTTTMTATGTITARKSWGR